MRRRTPHLVGLALVAVACSSSGDVAPTTVEPTPSTTVAATTTTGETTETTIEATGTGGGTASPGEEPDVGSAAGATGSAEIDVEAFDPAPLEWDSFDDAVDVATLEVPIDWADPAGGRFELYIARHRALDPDARIGSLLVNPGGPGSGGTYLAFAAPQIYDEEILRHFDVVAFDPRGTGQSDPIDCIDDYDPYFTAVDSTPESEAEREELVDVSRRFAQACLERNPDTYAHVGTNNAARDMDAIRRALDEDTISYFGFSYGSELGATWATLFPDTVRAAVLDGASDPAADELESSLQQLAGFEAALDSFLAWCSDDAACAFHGDGDVATAFDELMVALDANPVPSGDPSRPPVNRDVATTAVIQAMFTDARWPQLAEALAAAQDGDGAGLMAMHDAYYQRRPDGTYDDFLEAFPMVLCADSPERRTVAEIDADGPRYHEVAPRLAPEGSLGGYTCTFLPPALDPRIEITATGAPTILVIGTTGDPSTPLDSTIRMANALEDSRLLIVEADQHTGYGANRCVVEVVNDYLVDLSPPSDGTRCG